MIVRIIAKTRIAKTRVAGTLFAKTFLAGVFAIFASMTAAAQEAAPAAEQTLPTAGTAADQIFDTTLLLVDEAYEDWIVRCFDVQVIAPCDVLHVAISRDTQQRVLSVSIAYVPQNDAHVMQLILPLGVAISKGATIVAGENTLSGIKFARCERDGCYVEVPVPTALIESLSMIEGSTTITIWAYIEDQPIDLPLSLNGFAEAIAAMQEYARANAVARPLQQ